MIKDENCVSVKKDTVCIRGKNLFRRMPVKTKCSVSMCNGLIFFLVYYYSLENHRAIQ